MFLNDNGEEKNLHKCMYNPLQVLFFLKLLVIDYSVYRVL